MKALIVVLTLFATNLTYASSFESREVVEDFFGNYGLIENWGKFQDEQSKLLSQKLVTRVVDHRGEQIFLGTQGYFDSLADWSQFFATGPDFSVEIVKSTSNRVVARLHGTIAFKQPINGLHQADDDQHQWTEIFTIKNGVISKIEVLMNLDI